MDDIRYRIGELVEKAGVTKRTIHYYMGRGLLPPPDGAGLGTTYSREHLYRIMLIKKLQEEYLPLDEIKKRITGMNLEEVKSRLEKGTVEPGEKATRRNPPEQALAGEYAGTAGVRGNPYERIEIGLGLELHYPAGSRKARELAEVLYEQARKWMKEG